MSKHIVKYHLSSETTVIKIDLPKDFQILDIHEQNDNICLWALIDIHNEPEEKEFRIIGTGWKIDNIENLFFMKTIHMQNGLVFHIFESI